MPGRGCEPNPGAFILWSQFPHPGTRQGFLPCVSVGGPGKVPGFPSCRRLAVQPWTGKAAARLP